VEIAGIYTEGSFFFEKSNLIHKFLKPKAMNFKLKITLLLMISCFSVSIFAQKKVDTIFLNASWDTVQTKAEASRYRVTQTNGKFRITLLFDSLDMKLEEMSYRKDKSANTLSDSVWWKYGSFREWYPSGQLKVEGNYIYDRFHDNLKTYYPNGALKRNDVYYVDTLRQAHCYAPDSTEIAHFPYEELPEFKGGQREMFQFLADNIDYPRKALKKDIAGTVYVGFVINKLGNIVEVKIKRGVNEFLDKEAVRVVKSMPNWKPGKQDGELVRVAYTLPIKFKLK
jgi:TonB family protein